MLQKIEEINLLKLMKDIKSMISEERTASQMVFIVKKL